MNIKNKLKHWYTRPRSGRMFGFATWILTEPKALGIVLICGYIVSSVLFGILTLIGWGYGWNWIAKGIFTFGFLISLRNLYRYFKYHHKTGNAVNITMNDILYRGRYK